METTNYLLDKAREKCSPDTDMELARRLGVVRSAVSNWRSGRALPDVIACEKIANLTGVPVIRVIGIVGEARAISREEKAVWRRVAQTAAACLLLAVNLSYSTGLRAAERIADIGIMRNTGRRLRRITSGICVIGTRETWTRPQAGA